MVLDPLQAVRVLLLPDALVDLRAQFLRLLQSLAQMPLVWVRVRRALQDLNRTDGHFSATHTYRHTHTHTHTHAYRHTHTCTHTHIHAHNRTHTHTQIHASPATDPNRGTPAFIATPTA